MGYSRAQMAEAVGLRSTEQWSRYARGESLPSADVLSRLALHDVDIGYVLVGERNGKQMRALSADETTLLSNYRRSGDKDKETIQATAQLACDNYIARKLAKPQIVTQLS